MNLKKCKKLSIYEIIAIIAISIGIGMILSVIIPFWWWILIVGVGLVGLGYYCYK